jgi:hypothetical protein
MEPSRLPGWVVLLLCVFTAFPLSATDCNQNGVDDALDLARGTSPDCNSNGYPDECETRAVNQGFRAGQELSLFKEPRTVIAADFVAGASIDLAVVHRAESTVLLLANDGAGAFGGPRTLRVPLPFAVDLAAGDIDGNGSIDLLAAGTSGISRIPDRWDRLPAPTALLTGFDALSIALADLDRDDDLDLAVALVNSVRIFLNGGSGAFAEGAGIPIGSSPIAIQAADLDGDGDVDLLSRNSDSISVILNRGNGAFELPRNAFAGPSIFRPAIADFDGDRLPDLAVPASDLVVRLFRNRGNGVFAAPESHPLPAPPGQALALDVDGDGDLDLVLGLERDGAAILLNPGDGRFAGAVASGASGMTLAAADFDGDGRMEVAAVGFLPERLSILEPALVAIAPDCDADGVPDDCQLAGADCNQNGKPDRCDIATAASRDCDLDGLPDECESDCNRNGQPDDCDLALGSSPDCNRNGVPDECDIEPVIAFDTERLEVDFFSKAPLAAADFDADGDPDIWMSTQQGLEVIENLGGAGFSPPKLVLEDPTLGSLTPADFNGDGAVDLVSVSFEGRGATLLVNRGGGIPDATPLDAVAAGPLNTAPIAADLDGNEFADLVLAGNSPRQATILLDPARTPPGPRRIIDLGRNPFQLLARDLDGDGLDDILAASSEPGSVSVVLNRGGEGFGAPAHTAVGAASVHLVAAGDFSGDGLPDVVVAGASVLTLHLLLNDGRGRLSATPARALEEQPQSMLVGDFDGDTRDDLALLSFQRGALIGFEEVAGSSLRLGIFASSGDGLNGAPRQVEVASRLLPLSIARADVNLDRKDDGFLDCPNCLIFGSTVLVLTNESRPGTSLDRDGDGVPDECRPRPFHRGDADGDGRFGLTDAVRILDFLFRGGAAPGCRESADVDNDGGVRLNDPILILNHLFLAGPPPSAPGPPGTACGFDPDASGADGDLGCGDYPPCEDAGG